MAVKKIKFAALAVLLASLFLIWPNQKSCALDAACDPDYYKSLETRAWMEAQREITQNQNLIFKPDSVFEYTCFDRFMNELADHAKDMFSETGRWGAVPAVPVGSLETSLNVLVGDPLRTYLYQNFEYAPDNVSGREDEREGDFYDLLGGRAECIDHPFKDRDGKECGEVNDTDFWPRNKVIDRFETAYNQGSTGPTSAKYNCNIMRQVWDHAKCMNFIDNEATDAFFTFETYKARAKDRKDFRTYPRECDPGNSNSSNSLYKRWDNYIKWSTVNEDFPNGTPWEEDLAAAVFEFLNPTQYACAADIPLQTGISVTEDGDTGFVCMRAGCVARYNMETRTPSCVSPVS